MKKRALPAAALAGVVGAIAATGLAIGAAGDEDRSASLASKIDPSKPKNVILLVGDGMGDSEVTLARNYGKGAAGRLRMDELTFRGSSLHYVLSAGPGPTYAPNYVGDSAPTATAWSTGKRTIDNRLSQSPSTAGNVPGSNEGYKTTFEIARDAGKKVGNVSTAEITDATPAAPSSHISQRSCQGPADTRATCPSEAKSAGGLGSIAEQQVDHRLDVNLGGGRAQYEEPLEAGGTQNVIQYAQGKGDRFVSSAAQLDSVTSVENERLLGLFAPINMTKEYAELAVTLAGAGGPDTRCTEGNRPANEPSLSAMTAKAIDLLDDDPDGFFLQSEGASIDKQDHLGDVCGQIGETLEFDRAIGVALDYQKTHPDTMVMVTADHGHMSQMIPAGQDPEGEFATLKTIDGAPIRVSYGTARSDNQPTDQHSHTGVSVPVWASGPQAANVVGTLDQTDLFSILNGKVPSKLPSGPPTATPTPTASATPAPTATPKPTPTKPGRPKVGLAALRSIRAADLRSTGLELAFVVSDVNRLTVSLKQGSRTLSKATLPRPSASEAVRLRIKKSTRIKKGTAKLTLKATGPGGSRTYTRSIRVR